MQGFYFKVLVNGTALYRGIRPIQGDSTVGQRGKSDGRAHGGGGWRGVIKPLIMLKKNNAKESRWGNSYYRSMLQGISDEKKEN